MPSNPRPIHRDSSFLDEVQAHLERCDALGPCSAKKSHLSRYMRNHRQETKAYRRLVKHHPDKAVRLLVFQKMREIAEREKLANRLLPIAEQWAKELPGLHDLVLRRIQHMNDVPKPIAYVEQAVRVKNTHDDLRLLPW